MNFAVKIVSFLSFLICYERHLGPNNSLLHVIISFFLLSIAFRSCSIMIFCIPRKFLSNLSAC